MTQELAAAPAEPTFELRGAVDQLGSWVMSSEGKSRATNGGVPLEVMIAGQAGTGKSMGVALLILWIARRWQGCRILIVRKTRKSLTQSVLTTLEKILGQGHPFIGGANKENRSSYWIGTSEIVLGTMEDPDNLYSTEFDVVWMEEGRQIPKAAYNKFLRCLRNFKTPFQLLLTTTNPDSPAHHLYQRAKTGTLTHLVSVHKDNPAYWDQVNQRWLPEGEAYLRTLRNLQGNDYRRLYLGQWVAAEGAVYPDYDPAIHGVTLERDANGWLAPHVERKLDVRGYFFGYDWGWDHPGGLLVAAYAGNSDLYVIAQTLRRKQQPEWWADRIVELHARYRLDLGFCEHKPDFIELVNDRLGADRHGPGAIAVEADKDVDAGIAIVRARLTTTNPTLFFDTNSVYFGFDPYLQEKAKPTRIEEELPSYVYESTTFEDEGRDRAAKEKPLKIDDDLADALRYMCVGLQYYDPPASQFAMRKKAAPDSLWALAKIDEFYNDPDVLERDAIRGEVELFK